MFTKDQRRRKNKGINVLSNFMLSNFMGTKRDNVDWNRGTTFLPKFLMD